MEKRWWARIDGKSIYCEGYGRWVPTGMTELSEAKQYMSEYLRMEYFPSVVLEWVLL